MEFTSGKGQQTAQDPLSQCLGVWDACGAEVEGWKVSLGSPVFGIYHHTGGVHSGKMQATAKDAQL